MKPRSVVKAAPAAFAAAVWLSGVSFCAPLSPEFSEMLIERQVRRTQAHAREDIPGLLKVSPGQTVLDLGGGSGQFSFLFAEKLKGTGKVFLTDIDPKAVKYAGDEARRKGYSNILTVLVDKKGVDPFYLKNKFDLIFVAHTILYIEDGKAFFDKIKPALADNGRLAVLDLAELDTRPLATGDFADFSMVIAVLLAEPGASPFRKHLDPELFRKMKAAAGKGGVPEELRRQIVAYLNDLVFNARFSGYYLGDDLMLDDKLDFSNGERIFINLKERFLGVEARVLDKSRNLDLNNKKVNERHLAINRQVQRLMVLQKLRGSLSGQRKANLISGTDEDCAYVAGSFLSFLGSSYKLERSIPLKAMSCLWIYRKQASPAR